MKWQNQYQKKYLLENKSNIDTRNLSTVYDTRGEPVSELFTYLDGFSIIDEALSSTMFILN